MAAVLEQQEAVAKNNSRVDEQIAQATSRIRAHDLTFGGLILIALVLVYATAMIVLDKYVNLPESVRQFALAGFVLALAVVAYLTILSPLRKRINPLYAAKQVERTIDDPKNSVTGYVDAQQKSDLNATVKAALANRAAASVAEADVNKAVDHRSLLWLGGVVAAFFVALVVLFFVFRPTQFASLMGRTFVPFSSEVIASRTQLAIIRPDPVEPTITTGQSISVAVHVSGKVPKADSAERVRLLIRHNPADPNYTELPMVQGDTSRDWELRVPDYLVQNGFWYKVSAGDATTPEYKVTVRSLPLFTDFQTTYEYPKYLRRKNETASDHMIRAYRGTTVTLVARANRDVASGTMTIEPSNAQVNGTVVPGKPDSLQFVYKLKDTGKYSLAFTATNGERIAEPFQSTITVEADQAPQVVINKPEEEETTAPTNGHIAIDGKVGDDFGVDTITLRMKIIGAAERPLPPKPFLNGKALSFHREKDNTWPTDVDYKDSVDLATLKKDAAGLALELSPDMVIEYWLEATDNCTEPKANVGRSASKRVRLTAPKMDEQDKQNLEKQKDERKNEEKKHNADQQQKLDNENRDPQKGDKGGEQPKNGEPKNEKNEGQPKTGEQPKDGDPKKGENAGNKGDSTNPMQKGMNGMPPNPMDAKNPDGKGMGEMATAPMPKTPGEKNLDQKAEELQKEIDKENQNGGNAKSNNTPKEQDRTKPAEQKPQPPMGDMGNPAEQKPEQKNDGTPPASTKPEGNLEKPADPSTPKPEPKKDNPMKAEKGAAPSEKRNEPVGGATSSEKPEPKEPSPKSKDTNQKQDPNSGSTAKPATEKPNDMQDPAADAGSKAKPMPEPTRGGDKPNEPKAPPPSDEKPQGGEAKPEKAPPAGTPKPMPKEDMMGDMKPTETKPESKGAAEAKPDDPKQPPMPGAAERGMDKPQPKEDSKPQSGDGGNAPKPKEFSDKEKQEIQQAAKDLTNPDPQKKKEAQQKLDKAVGEENRKEMEKIANDLQSNDKDKQAAAQKKIEDAMKNAQGGKQPDKKDAPKLDEKQMKEIADAMKDLQSGDEQKKKEAQQKLDKMIGEKQRKEAEQLVKDLQSKDKDKKEAAQKKLDDMRKEMEKQAKKDGEKSKEPSKEEIADLMKKAQDLQSKDDEKRKQAEKDLDEKIGKENREKLQKEMKDQKPGDMAQNQKTKDQIEQMAKDQAKENEFKKPGPGGSSPPAKEAMEDDPKNRLKTAELRLEEFEKKKYDEAFLKKQGYTPEEYEKFLKEYEEHVKNLRDDVKKAAAPPAAPMPKEPGGIFNPSASGKVDARTGKSTGNVGGPTAAPPGFEGARGKFEKLINEKK